MRDPFPAWSGKNSWHSRRIQEEALSTGKARGTPGSCHHSQSPPDVSVHSRETCLPCTASTFKPRITHTTVARGTALWERLVGKPRGKDSWESHRSLGSREGKRDTAATAREEGSFPCMLGKEFPAFPSHPRGSALHRKGERNSRVVPPFPESPRCLSPFQGNLFSLHCLEFHGEDRLTPRWHVG